MGRVTVTSRVNEWAREEEATKMDVAILQLATDIHRLSQIKAPKDTRALVKSGRIERKERAHYTISYNTPYARRRHFENKKNPQSLNYLKDAGDESVKHIRKYFR
jgi:hypothetical protein